MAASGGVVHAVRDLAHGERILRSDVTQKEELEERNLATRKLFRELQHETTLEAEDDVGQAFDFARVVLGVISITKI